MCTRPITIRYSNLYTITTGYKSIQVPCGKCMECKARYQNDWAIRISQEIKAAGYVACFVTFTYNEDSVPKVIDKETGVVYRSVCKRHPQNCIKRFRTYYKRLNGKDAPLRYFLTSEYGPRTFRPHYHAIFFGLRKEQLRYLLDDWSMRYGYVLAKDITRSPEAAAKYVAKYCSKGIFECPFVKDGFVAPTFHLMSKGIGKKWLDDPSVRRHFLFWPPSRKYAYKDDRNTVYSEEFLRFVGFELRINLGDFMYSLPRYYRTKLYGTQTDLSCQVADYVFRRNAEVFDAKCQQVQSDRNCSYGEATYIVLREEDRDRLRREADTKERLERFYNKSRI